MIAASNFIWLKYLKRLYLPPYGVPPWSSGSVLDHISLPLVFESRRGHIWRLFRLWLRLITFGGRSAHLSFLVHKHGCKTSITNHHHHPCWKLAVMNISIVSVQLNCISTLFFWTFVFSIFSVCGDNYSISLLCVQLNYIKHLLFLTVVFSMLTLCSDEHSISTVCVCS